MLIKPYAYIIRDTDIPFTVLFASEDINKTMHTKTYVSAPPERPTELYCVRSGGQFHHPG